MSDREREGRLSVEFWPDFSRALMALGDDAAVGAIVDTLESEGAFTPAQAPPLDHRGMVEVSSGGRWYAIKDSDFPLLSTIADAIAAAGDLKFGTAITTLGKVLSVMLAAWRKGAMLSPHQGALLNTLRKQPGRRADSTTLAAASGYPSAKVDEILTALVALRRTDGAQAGFVERDGADWIAVGV